MSKWMLMNKKADFKTFGAALGVDQVVVRLMVNRGLSTLEEMKEYLHPTLDSFFDPHLLKDMDKACELIMDAIDEEKNIRVVGDYDVDGIMSTFILSDCIKKAGGNVDYVVPHRIEDGYGINPEMVQSAYDDGIDFIITCDNGIAAREACELAKKLGMTYVVTDHHEIPFENTDDGKKYLLPAADAIVDPKLEDCMSPFKEICGAQVAFKFAYVLFEMLGFEESEYLYYLQFAAMACVCDVMPLVGENRALVYHGLKAIQNSTNKGIHALLARNSLLENKLSCYHLGFVLGPCFNASGRLDTAMSALELLQEEDEAKALFKAQELVEINSQRKNMTQTGLEQALDIIEKENMSEDKVLVIYIPDLHESLAGIVAGRIKEQFFRPTLVFTDAAVGAKGSGRSIEAYNMFEELTKVKDLFTKFGGHPMAAGVSLPIENIGLLRQRLNENCTLTASDMEEVVRIDMAMPLSYISQPLVESLELLEPFGNKNTKPVFALKDIEIIAAAHMGGDNQFLRLTLLMENNRTMTGLLFRKADEFLEMIERKYSKSAMEGLFSKNAGGVKMDIIYQPSLNTYRGNTSVQIIIDQFK